MSDDELRQLFTGYGWTPLLAVGPDLVAALGRAMDDAFAGIDRIQHEARSGHQEGGPRWPMIILRSPKGWTGVKILDGEPVEGSFRSHQVPVADVRKNADHLRLVEDWFRSYRPEELFDAEGRPHADLLTCCPSGKLRIGCNPAAAGERRVPPAAPRPQAACRDRCHGRARSERRQPGRGRGPLSRATDRGESHQLSHFFAG